MRYVWGVLGLVVFFAGSSRAQVSANTSLILSSTPLSTLAPATDPGIRLATPALPQGPGGSRGGETVSIYQHYSWQFAIGYTFFRFYEVPGVTKNLNGFTYSMGYYFKDWVGVEGELTGGLGSLAGQTAEFVFGGGGPQVRWSLPRRVEVFAHGLAGHAHFTPRTPFGGEDTFAYELGGGIDITAHHRRLAYRLGVDMLGTQFFHTSQFSPKLTTGIVLKF